MVNDHLTQQDAQLEACKHSPCPQLAAAGPIWPTSPSSSAKSCTEPSVGDVSSAGTTESIPSPSRQVHRAQSHPTLQETPAIYRTEGSQHSMQHTLHLGTVKWDDFWSRKESLWVEAAVTLLHGTDLMVFTCFLWGYTKVADHMSTSHWDTLHQVLKWG